MTHRFSFDDDYEHGDVWHSSFSQRAPFSLRGAAAHASLAIDERPLTIYEPDYYEPNYAYPLIVWLPGLGGTDREVLDLMPYISSRNYIGVSLPGVVQEYHLRLGSLHRHRMQPREHAVEIGSQLHRALDRLRQCYNIHSERILLAGFDEGATMALGLMLHRPEWFGGAIALNAQFPHMQHPLSRYRDLHGKRVLLGASAQDNRIFQAEMTATSRLLHAAGIDVSTRIYQAGYEITEEMLTDIDHWIMAGIHSAV